MGAQACARSGLTDADVDRAFDEGRILRTHVLRPTWHFVAPRRYPLAAGADRAARPQDHAYYRKQRLDDGSSRAAGALERALEGGDAPDAH